MRSITHHQDTPIMIRTKFLQHNEPGHKFLTNSPAGIAVFILIKLCFASITMCGVLEIAISKIEQTHQSATWTMVQLCVTALT